jgi:DNA-directed RNA polymerase II subunit RPB7
MFFLHEDERTITVHPSFLGPNTRRYIRDQLFRDVEGTTNGTFYYICVMELDDDDISEGRVVPGNSYTEYTVHFKAIVWRPFPGEVVGVPVAVGEACF